MHLVYKVVQVKLSPSNHTDKNKIHSNRSFCWWGHILLCDRCCTTEWEHNFPPTSWGKIREETQSSMHIHNETSPSELAHLTMPLTVVPYLVSVCIKCTKLFHKRCKLNGQIISFATRGTGGEHRTAALKMPGIWLPITDANISIGYYCRSLGRPRGSHGYDDTITFDHIKQFLGQLLGKDYLPPIQQRLSCQKLAF